MVITIFLRIFIFTYEIVVSIILSVNAEYSETWSEYAYFSKQIMDQACSLNSVIIVLVIILQIVFDCQNWLRQKKNSFNQLENRDILKNRYEKMLLTSGLLPVLPLFYLQLFLLVRNCHISKDNSWNLFNLVYLLFFILNFGIAVMAFSTWFIYIKDRHSSLFNSLKREGKMSFEGEQKMMGYVFIVIIVQNFVQYIFLIDCSFFAEDSFSNQECIRNSFFTRLMGDSDISHSIINLIYLFVVEVLPTFAFLTIYVPKVKLPID